MFLKNLKIKDVVYFAFAICCIFNVQSSYAQGNYNVGVGIYDVTGQIAEANHFGYATPLHRNAGLRDRQYARAFIIQESGGDPVVFVCIDKGGTFQSVNQAVVARLEATYGALYRDENVIISATHTHVASGGFSHYSLYNLATGGYWKTNFNNLVDGIYNAIVRAHNNIAPGSIYYNKGSLTNASINRSLVAYELNVDAENFPSIDEDMTVLKFVQGDREVGMISWFAVHPTNLSNSYKQNSADNKGYAALKFERLKNSTYGESDVFVAAFANTNAGDMSPNLNLPSADQPNQDATGPGENEEESANIIGSRQYEAALELYNSATEQLTGSVAVVSRYSDFSNIAIAPKFTDGELRNTCQAALGISFTAGAEDGRSGIGREGITKNPNAGAPIGVCHAEKPIAPFFFVGEEDGDIDTPKILPTTLMKIGQLGILGVPTEFTVMSGRRARATVEAVQGTGITQTVVAGYSDAYAGYVTTREEYASQQYEGASTHFGPWTLAAYRQEFERLATKLADPLSSPWPDAEPQPPLKAAPGLNVTTPILFDATPRSKNFGDVEQDANASYKLGDRVEVVFWGAHPNNDLKVNDTYLTVEREEEDGSWKPLYLDRDPVTKLVWARDGLASSKITITWDIPEDAPTGRYRIRHSGKWKSFFGRKRDYEGSTSNFFVGDDDQSAARFYESAKRKKKETNAFAEDLQVYPNPNQGSVTLNVSNDFSGKYEVISLIGTQVLEGTIDGKQLISIDLSNQTKGVYLLKVTHKNGTNHVYKLMRE